MKYTRSELLMLLITFLLACIASLFVIEGMKTKSKSFNSNEYVQNFRRDKEDLNGAITPDKEDAKASMQLNSQQKVVLPPTNKMQRQSFLHKNISVIMTATLLGILSLVVLNKKK